MGRAPGKNLQLQLNFARTARAAVLWKVQLKGQIKKFGGFLWKDNILPLFGVKE